MVSSERDLIACLDQNHKLMSQKEKLESEITALEEEIKGKQQQAFGCGWKYRSQPTGPARAVLIYSTKR
ncbi:hypothetical protein DOTSEDRAFT_23919 [Dothistroma septosporum NZE10]|uniref:Uncharacterized protein n=1 Tax=Dothistroma septosporum (strain NZE10 / CBS 128990) TaxID=675120 RepID=N1PMZ3_DOTSN|nr:hypothetical protein DOTSEDRAFT_23919 [Dothistroma septosporum NZE10]